jgi:ubiquinone/menaquinone biosynthesis C-methylase UbiE
MALAHEAMSGFQKGRAYDQNRPSYLLQVVDKLLHVLRISGVAGAQVLDLAAGTGKFTELLAKQHEQFQITAVEPHDVMRNELEKKHLSNVHVRHGFATKIPLADETVDAVVIAQVRG